MHEDNYLLLRVTLTLFKTSFSSELARKLILKEKPKNTKKTA